MFLFLNKLSQVSEEILLFHWSGTKIIYNYKVFAIRLKILPVMFLKPKTRQFHFLVALSTVPIGIFFTTIRVQFAQPSTFLFMSPQERGFSWYKTIVHHLSLSPSILSQFHFFSAFWKIRVNCFLCLLSDFSKFYDGKCKLYRFDLNRPVESTSQVRIYFARFSVW